MLAKLPIVIVLAGVLTLFSSLGATPDYELQPLEYSKAKDHNGITALRKTLDLKQQPATDSLRQILQALNVPESSQMLVFSKTSEQNDLISPNNPRAIYFSENYYVGYVPGGLIELIAADDPSGVMFYTFDPRVAENKKTFKRDNSCLRCHASGNTRDIPGLLVRSVHADQDGQLALAWGTHLTVPSSPITERWGGWYVSGNHGDLPHMGNKITKKLESGEYTYTASHGQNVEDLSDYINTTGYLADTSDIVALMVVEHQVHMHNAFFSARFQYQRSEFLHQALHPESEHSTQMQKLIHRRSDEILASLLFSDHAALPADGVDGSADFQKDFVAAGRASEEGWSLRDFRLQKRLFKYRCSYTIHSKAFSLIPAPIKRRVLANLRQHLTGAPIPGMPVLSERERTRIHTILTQTLKGY
ncbi:MAG: hypothetical protein ACI9FG_001452 [Crocinitomicaceae bacterium]|jgi:hypothetical protein